ncbi:MAG: efflux RND transporter periplasmic adaptor subunit [Pseudomonadota bacterium]
MGQPVSMWKQLILTSLLIGCAVAFWVAPAELKQRVPFFSAKEAASEERQSRSPQAPVIVAPVERAADDFTIEIVGTGRALRTIMLRSEAAGRITNLALEPDVPFEAGTILLQLDSEDERLALELAEARLAEATRIRGRVSSLTDRGVASDARLSEVETAFEIARLEVQRAKQALDKRTLLAPFAGESGLPLVEEGAWIDSGVDIAPYDDRSVIFVEFDVPQAALSRVSTGLNVEAITPILPGRIFTGTVSAIDSRLDATSRTARVRVAIPNPADELRPGASFTIRLLLPGPIYPVVPELALLFDRDGLHVWRIIDGAAEQVPVTLVRRRDGSVLIDGPLSDTDLVVVEGTQRLSDGRAVNIIGTRAGRSS